MIEGKRITVITKVFSHDRKGRSVSKLIERQIRVTKFRQYLTAGTLPNGGVRRQDLIQFYGKDGKLHTVAAVDVVL